MNRAGEAVGDSLLRDMKRITLLFHIVPVFLFLWERDTMAEMHWLRPNVYLKTIPTARALVWPYCSWDEVRTLCKRAYDEMIELVGKRVQEIKDLKSFSNESEIESTFFDLCCEEFSASIDGFLGMQAQLPLCPKLTKLVSLINQTDRIGVRVAVDIPTGVGEGLVNEALKADFTYATGIAKSPIISVETFNGLVGYAI